MDEAGRDEKRRLVDRLPADLAEGVAAEVSDVAGGEDDVRLGAPSDRRAALVGQQQSDYDEVVQGPPVSTAPISGPQARGAITGAVTFGAIGLVVGVLIGLIPMFDLPIGARIGIWALVCTLGASASGFVFGGGREPELEGATIDESESVTVAVESADPEVLGKADRLMAEADLEAAQRARKLAEDDRPRGTL
jgi:hypothetical protein